MNNWLFMFPCAPSRSTLINTSLVLEGVKSCFTQGYNKLRQELIFPENLKSLRHIESKMELVTIPTLQNLRIDVRNFRAAKITVIIFLQDTLECDMEPIDLLKKELEYYES